MVKKNTYYIIVFIILSFLLHEPHISKNLEIKNTSLIKNESNGDIFIQFDIRWNNSWRNTTNWDAVWIFFKYKTKDGEWRHGTLSNRQNEHYPAAGSEISTDIEGKGICVYMSDYTRSDEEFREIKIKWDIIKDNIPILSDNKIKAFGLEKVYIPKGKFFAGDYGYSIASFKSGANDISPWPIRDEREIKVTDCSEKSHYYTSTKNKFEDSTGASFIIPDRYPKGYRAIYCMKYELTQGEYSDFLNCLTENQSKNRFEENRRFRYQIYYSKSNEYFTNRPNRACNNINWGDAAAYADWDCIRPVIELEYKKIC